MDTESEGYVSLRYDIITICFEESDKYYSTTLEILEQVINVYFSGHELIILCTFTLYIT